MVGSIRSESFSEPLVFAVDRGTGSFSFPRPRLPLGRHELLAWVPGLGAWNGGEVEILPGRGTDFSSWVPLPGHVLVRVLPGSGGLDGWIESTGVPELQGSAGSMSSRRLKAGADPCSFQAELFRGEYSYWVRHEGVDYVQRRVRIESGRTTEETGSLEEAVPMALHLVLARSLQPA